MRIGLGINISTFSGAGGGSTFLPTDISDLLIWCRADTWTAPLWTDQSGAGNNLVNANALQQPTQATGGQYNGHEYLTFDGSNDFYATAGSITYGAHTVSMVARPQGGAAYLWQRAADVDYCWGTTGNSIEATRSAVTSSKNHTSNWGVMSVPNTITVSFDGTHAGHKLRLNEVDQSLTTVSGSDPGTGTAAAAFALFGSTAGASVMPATIGEIVAYSRALTTQELNDLEGYFRDRYAHY